MTIESTYHGEVRVVRSSYTSKTGPTLTLALHDIDELNKVQGMDGKRYMLALVEIGDDEQPVQPEKKKGGPLSILAARWCREPEFLNFIRPIYDRQLGGNGSGWGDVSPDDFDHDQALGLEQYAAHCIKVLCDCEQSRRELDIDAAKGEKFHRLIRGPYIKWMAARGVITAPEYEEA